VGAARAEAVAATGAAVIALDHVPKSKEDRGRYAIGAQHKLAGLTGAAFSFAVLRPFRRARGAEPEEGIVTMSTAKDRPGDVRAIEVGKVAAVVHLVAYPDGGVTVKIDAPDPIVGVDADPNLAVARRIIEHLAQFPGATKNDVEHDVNASREEIRVARDWLIGKGWVEVKPKGNAHRLWLTEGGMKEYEQ
jgi:hypothetical protein